MSCNTSCSARDRYPLSRCFMKGLLPSNPSASICHTPFSVEGHPLHLLQTCLHWNCLELHPGITRAFLHASRVARKDAVSEKTQSRRRQGLELLRLLRLQIFASGIHQGQSARNSTNSEVIEILPFHEACNHALV